MGICSSERAQSRTVAVAIDGMSFIRPVKLGDILCGYAEILEEEHTSLKINLEAWVNRDRSRNTVKITETQFKFVVLDIDGRPRPIPNA